MQKHTDIDANATRISANTLQDMLKCVFAVAALVAKSEEQQGKSSTHLQKRCEKTQK
jgi:hypothetical protein